MSQSPQCKNCGHARTFHRVGNMALRDTACARHGRVNCLDCYPHRCNFRPYTGAAVCGCLVYDPFPLVEEVSDLRELPTADEWLEAGAPMREVGS
jgi:hypothetical protein